MKTVSAEKVKKSKLRSIGAGTINDVGGSLQRFSRALNQGKHGDVRDVIIIARKMGAEPNCYPQIVMEHYGTGTIEAVHWMVSTAKNRIEPA